MNDVPSPSPLRSPVAAAPSDQVATRGSRLPAALSSSTDAPPDNADTAASEAAPAATETHASRPVVSASPWQVNHGISWPLVDHLDECWASDYAAPTPSFPLTPQAQRDKVRKARAAQLASQRAAVVLQCLCRSHMARAQLGILRSDRASPQAERVDAQEKAGHTDAAAPAAAAAAAAIVLQCVCRTHLIKQLRAWFAASAACVPSVAPVAGTCTRSRVHQRRSDTRSAQRAGQRGVQPSRRERSSDHGAEIREPNRDLRNVTSHAAKKELGELTHRIRSLERQLGRSLGQPASAARKSRRRRRPQIKAHGDTSNSSLRVKARPTVAKLMSTSAGDVHVDDQVALGAHTRHAIGRSRSTGTLGSGGALEQFSAEWSHGSVDGWSQWLPRHRWFQGLASQLHALHSLADPLAGADDDTRSYIREYVERELSYPHRTSGHRMDGGNAIESAVAHSSAWKPGCASISSQREFGAPPALPRRVAPTAPARDHWVTRLYRKPVGSLHDTASDSPTAALPSAKLERLKATLRQDVGGTTGFGIVLQCDPASSLHDRRLQPPSNTTVTAVTPGSDASAAGVVAGMAVLCVNGRQLRPDTTVTEINEIFEGIVGLPSADFEFETKGLSQSADACGGSVLNGRLPSGRVFPKGWCAHAQSAVARENLGSREAMIVVLWNGGGTAHTAASSMCEHAAHQVTDVISKCFKSGLVRNVVCVEAGPEASKTAEDESLADTAGLMWSCAADEMLRRMVPEHTSPTGGRIAWSGIAAKLTGWSQATSSPCIYSGRGCQQRWEEVLDPNLHQWVSLRPPQLSIWWYSVGGSTDTDAVVPEQLYLYTSQDESETTWPSEDDVVTLVGARIHHHLEATEQDTEDVVSALHKQVRQQMRSRRALHTEIGTWQAKNKELERKCAQLAAAQLSQQPASGKAAKIYSAICSNPLHQRAAPSRETTPAGAAAVDLVPGLDDTMTTLLPVTDVTSIPMPVLSVDSPVQN